MRSTGKHVKEEVGQTMAEYAVVLSVLFLGALAAFGLLSGAVASLIERTTGLIP